MNTNQNTTNPPAYLDRDGQVWPADSDLDFADGPLVQLWPDGKAPQPDTYVWTKGDDDEELKNRIVEGAHVAVERSGETRAGLVSVAVDGSKRIGSLRGTLLVYGKGVLSVPVYRADRVTVVPPPEPVLPEWITYRGDGYVLMLAITSDGQVWWPYATSQWMQRGGGNNLITADELIARGGRLLVDHTGHAVEEGR